MADLKENSASKVTANDVKSAQKEESSAPAVSRRDSSRKSKGELRRWF